MIFGWGNMDRKGFKTLPKERL